MGGFFFGSLAEAWGTSESPPELWSRARGTGTPRGRGIRSDSARRAMEITAARSPGRVGGGLAQLPGGYEGDLLTTLAIYEPG